MRISDWSSDVCSSDLLADRCEADDFQLARAEPWDPPFAHREAVETTGFAERLSADERGGAASPSGGKFRLARREGTASRWFAYNHHRQSQSAEKTMPHGFLENELKIGRASGRARV